MNAASREVDAFVHGRPRAVRIFRIAYPLFALNFAVPAVIYLLSRSAAERTFSDVNVALGGAPLEESGELWHMLAIGNVATLALLCTTLWLDLRRAHAQLPVLVFLKMTSAVVSLWLAITEAIPAFFVVFVLDGATSLAMWLIARAAADAMEEPERALPLWTYLLIRPRAVRRSLARIEAAGLVPRVPTMFQILIGVARMQARIATRPSTMGTSRSAVRRTRRARLFAFRPLRAIVLLWERAIAPLDLSGLASPPERIVCHVLAAHHDGAQLAYDLELLSLYPGWLELLRDAARRVVDERTPRATFLKDLCVFEGYHEDVLARTEAMLAGGVPASPREMADPDLSLSAHLAWCTQQGRRSLTANRLHEGDSR